MTEQSKTDTVINKTEIRNLKNWAGKVDEKLDRIQNRQNLEMTVLFVSIATFLISHFT